MDQGNNEIGEPSGIPPCRLASLSWNFATSVVPFLRHKFPAMIPRLLIVSTLLTLSATAQSFERDPEKVILRAPRITEASGIASSPSDPDLLWIINDSGGTAQLHLVGTDGTPRGTVTLQGAPNQDWEDLAAFEFRGKPYLLIADTGDNANSRGQSALHIVREPAATDPTVAPAWTIRFHYEDGPRDCEAVAVDEKAGKIILISKRTKPPALYELPIRPAGGGVQTARKIGSIARVLPKGRSLNIYGSQPTGLDISPDGTLAAVVTYCGTFLFPRQPRESWDSAFSKAPVILAPHRLGQAESVAFSRDGKSLRLVSEGARSPLVTYRRGADKP